ncbi:MAG: hypothetical protein KDK90_20785 [Leptospiraceae bacterium]|nr:hypothetical protein [Leptospiraceae bacterium]
MLQLDLFGDIMSYFESDDLNIWVDTHFPLPQTLRNKLISKEEILLKLSQKENPIELSTQKWVVIQEIVDFITQKGSPIFYYKELYDYIGFETCALCLVSTEHYIKIHGSVKYAEDKCRVCPLAAIDRCTAEFSNFDRIIRILYCGFSYLENRHETMSDEEISNNHYLLIEYIGKMIQNLEILQSK